MKIFSISDLHLDSLKGKPMDIFGENWINHEEKIFKDWKEKVNDEDIVLMPGDISWAISLENAYKDLKLIDQLKGTKIICKGNHDYWWSSIKKMNELNLKSLFFIHNNCFSNDRIEVFGSRGWISKDSEEFGLMDEKVYNREINRLNNSFAATEHQQSSIKIAMIHYPPFNSGGELNDFGVIIESHHADICLYGHLHGKEGHKYIKEGTVGKTSFHCVAADFLDFKLKLITEV
jgi:uncharacterized protein